MFPSPHLTRQWMHIKSIHASRSCDCLYYRKYPCRDLSLIFYSTVVISMYCFFSFIHIHFHTAELWSNVCPRYCSSAHIWCKISKIFFSSLHVFVVSQRRRLINLEKGDYMPLPFCIFSLIILNVQLTASICHHANKKQDCNSPPMRYARKADRFT